MILSWFHCQALIYPASKIMGEALKDLKTSSESGVAVWWGHKALAQGSVLSEPTAVVPHTVVPSIYDLMQSCSPGWHPWDDLIFMFANLPLYLPVVAINTLLCLPEKCLKKQFVRLLYGLTWQYSWLTMAAKFRVRPWEFSNLICLRLLHLSITPTWLY